MPSALHPQTLLAYEMNGEPLTDKHGAPLRLVMPVKYGIKNIKRIGQHRVYRTSVPPITGPNRATTTTPACNLPDPANGISLPAKLRTCNYNALRASNQMRSDGASVVNKPHKRT